MDSSCLLVTTERSLPGIPVLHRLNIPISLQIVGDPERHSEHNLYGEKL